MQEENKRQAHLKSDLVLLQDLPLEGKVLMTMQRIKEWFDYYDGKIYLSWSGGKDSTVLKHIIENTPGVYDVPIVFVDTGLEYPELKQMVYDEAKINNNIVILRPKYTFKEVIDKYGYPVISKEQAKRIREYRHSTNKEYKKKLWNGRDSGRGFKIADKYKYLVDAPFEISEKCCDVMKKRPAHKYNKETGRMVMTAMLATESNLRLQTWLKYGCNAFDAENPRSMPMAFWTEQDILQYIKEHNLKIPSVYGDIIETEGGLALTGVQRTGCMFCMFGVQYEEEPNRFQIMKETHPAIWDYCINKLNLKQVLDYIYVPYEEEGD